MFTDLTLPGDFRSPELRLLAAALNDGTREARDELGEVSPEELAFAPMPGRHNAAAVLLHHADVETCWIRGDLCGEPFESFEAEFPELSGEDSQPGRWPNLGDMTLADIYRRSDAVRAITLERLARIEDAETIAVAGSGETARWIVNHLIGHEAYHFGQAVLLVEMARAK